MSSKEETQTTYPPEKCLGQSAKETRDNLQLTLNSKQLKVEKKKEKESTENLDDRTMTTRLVCCRAFCLCVEDLVGNHA